MSILILLLWFIAVLCIHNIFPCIDQFEHIIVAYAMRITTFITITFVHFNDNFIDDTEIEYRLMAFKTVRATISNKF